MSYNYSVVFFAALGAIYITEGKSHLLTPTGSLTYGFCNSVIGSVLGLPSFFEYFDLDTTGPAASKVNAIVGAMNGMFAGGGTIGALILTWLADKAGRVRAVQITRILCILSGALQAGSVHIGMFLVGRFISVTVSNMIESYYDSLFRAIILCI